jgi:polar amino acid transport system ATP-binding protein
VLDGVSFSVKKREVFAIIGRSGSGKSTALRCINRLERIDHGRIQVAGHEVSDPKLDLHQLRRDVGIVFQSYNLFPHLTVAENIALAPQHSKGKTRAQARELTERVLAQVGLSDKARSYPEQLSGGQQQRVAIARSLAMEPQVMLFDEVTSALDPQLTAEVLKVMADLAAGGMTMVLVTHEMAFARNVANTTLFMHQGRVWEQGGPEMFDRPQTTELQQFLGSGL